MCLDIQYVYSLSSKVVIISTVDMIYCDAIVIDSDNSMTKYDKHHAELYTCRLTKSAVEVKYSLHDITITLTRFTETAIRETDDILLYQQ